MNAQRKTAVITGGVQWHRAWHCEDVAGPGLERVNAVAPGIVDSPMHAPQSHESLKTMQPAGRLGTIGEIASAVLYLVGAEFTNSIVLPVDGGASAGCC